MAKFSDTPPLYQTFFLNLNRASAEMPCLIFVDARWHI